MENEKKFEIIKKDEKHLNKKYSPLNNTFMTNFNKGKDISNDDSNLKYNQINTVDKYGLIYFYNESGIYFMDNSKLKNLKIKENQDLSYTDLFFIKCEKIFNVFQIEKDDNIFLIICTKNKEEYSFLFYISLDNLIESAKKEQDIYDIKIIEQLDQKEKLFSKGYYSRGIDELEKNIELNEEGIYPDIPKKEKLTLEQKKQLFIEEKNEELRKRNEIFLEKYKNSNKYDCEKIIYLDENYEEIIIIDYDNYIVRYNNGDIIFYKNYERTRLLEIKSTKMSYNKDTNIFLIMTEDKIYVYKETNNFTHFNEKKQILLKNVLSTSIKEEKIIHIENIYNFIILYSIENKEEPENSDKLYFIQMNSAFDDIIKIYLEKEFFYPDDFELEGIAYYNHLKREVFTIYDKDINVYFVFNKHMDLLDKYYCFQKINEDDDVYDIFFCELNDDEKLNSRIKNLDKFPDNEEIQKIKDNAFIGVSIIKFKFDSYNDEHELIKGEEFIPPYLILAMGYYGGFKLCYIINENQEANGKIQYQLKEINDLFKKAEGISNKSLKIEINDEKAELEREKFLSDSRKKDSFTEVLNRKKLNLRNIFLHELDLQIKENLSKIKKGAYAEKLKIDLIELGNIANKKIFEDLQKSVDDLIKNAEDLFKSEEENQLFIKQNKEITEKNKNLENHIKNEIKKIEENKNKFKELNLNINSPINLILTHPKLKNFFGENEVNSMISLYNEIKQNLNLYQNHTNLIEKLNQINYDFIQKIKNCKKNYISKKDYDCLKKRKDFEDVKKKIQNNTFLMYMKIFNEYFWDLYQFKEKEMTEELNNLNELKTENYLLKNNKLEEEKNQENDDIKISNEYQKKKKRFILREEEDIDEGNNSNSKSNNDFNININNISNIRKSYKNDNSEQKLILANDNRIINHNYNDNKNIIIEREKNVMVKKIFNMDLVKEKNYQKKNNLSEILSNFQGRITLYDESSEGDMCMTAEELFSDLLKTEQEKKLDEKKLKALKDKKDKEKNKIKKSIDKLIVENKKEREKIAKELQKIKDEEKAEIIEKENEIKQLKDTLDEMTKKFEENRQERAKEKQKYQSDLEKKNNEEQQKIIEEKNKSDELIKKMEKDLQEFKDKLSMEERKRKEFEEKNKKLEDDIKNINNSNQNQNQNVFVREASSQEKKDENITKKNSLFEEINVRPSDSINLNKIPLFTSNMTEKESKKEEDKNVNSIDANNLFETKNTKNINIFSNLKTDDKQEGIFGFVKTNNQNQTNPNSLPNINDNNNKNESNNNPILINNNNNNTNNIFNNNSNPNENIFAKINSQQNIQQNTQNINNIFSNLNLNSSRGNQNQGQVNNSLGQNQPMFGQHKSFAQANNGNKLGNINNISFSFGNIQNTQTNDISPFASLGNNGGIFGNNQNGNSNQNQDNYF